MNDDLVRKGDRVCIKLLAMCALALSGVGCMTMPRGVTLDKPGQSAVRIDRTAWLAKVETPKEGLWVGQDVQKETLDNALTMNIKDYIEQGCYFNKVQLYRGIKEGMNEKDVVLRFTFERLLQKNKMNPMYVPYSLITATLFIWFGGAVTYDYCDMKCRLTVEDSGGKQLAEFPSEVKTKEGVSVYQAGPFGGTVMDVAAKSGIRHRSTIVKDLLDQAVKKLSETSDGAK